MNLNEVRLRRAAILELAGRRGARNVRIFGSVSRGEARSESDVDFLVKFDADRSLFDLAGLELDLEDLLNCRVDVVTEGGLSPYMADNILSEAIPL